MKRFIIITLYISHIFSIDISSKNANFDSKRFVLEGEITLKHPLGSLESKKGFLKKKKRALLLEAPSLTLSSGGFIKGKFATLFPSKNKIIFENSVTFSKKSPYSIEIKSKVANIKKGEIEFIGDVTIASDILSLFAKKAIFKNDLVEIFPKDPIHYKNLSITSPLITIYPKEKRAFIENPDGFIDEDEKIFFSSKELLIEENLLSFIKKAKIRSQDMTFLSDKIDIFMEDKKIKEITTSKNSSIEKKNRSFKLTSKEPLRVRENLISSTSTFKKNIYIQMDGLEITSKSVFLNLNNSKIGDILLEGDVSCISKKDNKTSFAIADNMLIKKKSITLKSLKNKKVLFWGDDDKISISAKKIEILKNPEMIRGFGSVRFSLNALEKKKLQEVFDL